VTGVPGMPLPGGHPDLAPCGTLAAYRRHLRDGLRGREIDRACRQAVNRDREDRAAAGWVRPSRARRVHQALRGGAAKCGRERVAVSPDPGEVTCLNCLGCHHPMTRRPAPRERARAA